MDILIVSVIKVKSENLKKNGWVFEIRYLADLKVEDLALRIILHVIKRIIISNPIFIQQTT